MNSFSTRNHYHDFELQRDQLMKAAERERLLHKAIEHAPKTQEETDTRLMTLYHSLHLVRRPAFVLMIVIALVLFGALPAFAQEPFVMDEEGISEPYHPALVQFRIGYFHQLQGEHEQAVAEFGEVISSFPTWSSGYSARGDSYAALELYEEALNDYDKALLLDPTFVSVLYMRGRACAAIGEFEAAQADYENAIAQMPEYAMPYWGMGDLMYERGELDAAHAYYHQYASLAPDGVEITVAVRMTELDALAVSTHS